jgi:hypothetical protein
MRSFRQMMGMGVMLAAWVSILGVSHAQAQTYTRYVWGAPVSYEIVTAPSVVVAPTTVVMRPTRVVVRQPRRLVLRPAPVIVSAAPVPTETRVIRSAPVVERWFVQSPTLIEERVIQSAPVVERRYLVPLY